MEQRRYAINLEVEYLTRGVYKFSRSDLSLLLKQRQAAQSMGKPTSNEQKTAFEIRAACVVAKEFGGETLAAQTLGAKVGQLERNAQYWSDSTPENEKWELKVIAELRPDIERVVQEDPDTYNAERTNVSYGTWRNPDMLRQYLDMMNELPMDEISPLLHLWYERFIIETATNVTPPISSFE